ncbi:MAG: FAD-dependent oxidoreductase [Clostridiales bacterium]|nr:FAD-dependent oxidoreductase [Clostridiales bacterium]MCF8021950.1 FAD-dependent oxidoreductase [Clostridiales bacterium]
MSANKVGAVLVVGGGIAGIQATLDLVESGYYVYLVEQSSTIGGNMSKLDKAFPTDNSSMSILAPKLVEFGSISSIQYFTNTQISEVAGEAGDFKVKLSQTPNTADTKVCTNYVTPVELPNAGQDISGDDNGKSGDFEVNVGAVILCPGGETFEADQIEYLGYNKYPNVVTSIEFERILRTSDKQSVIRPSDNKKVNKIAWIQCVGSRNIRDEKHYCSCVCCMYAIKEAVCAKQYSDDEVDTSIFYMDMRTYGKDFEKYYEEARDDHGVNFIRSRIYAIEETKDGSNNLLIRYGDDKGEIHHEEFDMVVLSVGFKPSDSAVQLGNNLGIKLNDFNFAETTPFTSVNTSKPGIYVAGIFGGPKDIPETVIEASAAAGASEELLSDVRGTMIQEKTYPPEKDVSGEEPRIGVFVCNCGNNIGGVVNVPKVVESAKALPYVVYSQEFLYTCSQDSQEIIKQKIEEHSLNRIIIASCSPRKLKYYFQETIREAGLNRYLFEMVNIRDQCSFVHMNEPEKATEKAKDLVKLSVNKAGNIESLNEAPVNINPKALVIGGGVSGMTNALNLAKQGYQAHIVEKSDRLGGNARRISTDFNNQDVQSYLNQLVDEVNSNTNIQVTTQASVSKVDGYVGNFVTTLSNNEKIEHGVITIAIGGHEYKPNEYLYNEHNAVLTQLELEEEITANNTRVKNAKNIVLIQCVGSREPDRRYCSRICCNKSVKMALQLQEMNPDANIYILYRDMRTYGFNEENYRKARKQGVIFIRYEVDNKPQVQTDGKDLKVTAVDHILGENITIDADIVGLAAAILPPEDGIKLNQIFNLSLSDEGFYRECPFRGSWGFSHKEMRPVDFASEGIFVAGLAQGPKSIDESIAQAKATASREATILNKNSAKSSGIIAVVQREKCAACYTCARLCPFNAPRIINYAAEIEPILCQGCGICAAECPNKAIILQNYSDVIFTNMVDELYREVH